ncbi:MAG: hypothetical protein WBB82_05770, partial [Limnothrix sp.]
LFHGLLQHRSLNREGLAELLHRSDLDVSALSADDEDRLAIAAVAETDASFWDDEDDESLFAPPPNLSGTGGEDTAFIKGILSEISSDLQDIKSEKVTPAPEPKGLVIQQLRQNPKLFISKYRWPIALGTAAAIALGGFLLWQRNNSVVRIPIVAEQSLPSNTSDFEPLENDTLIAIARKQTDDWPTLRKVSIELLDRQANTYADEVLMQMAREHEADHDSAELSFLRGRLAWQSALKMQATGNNTYDVEDARRSWETSTQEDPDSIEAWTALGFAYYARADYEAANVAWSEAFALAETIRATDAELAQIYAGLALGLYQQTQTSKTPAPTNLSGKWEKMRGSAIGIAPEAVEIAALAQNWLWSESAIADWKKLLTLD